MKKITLEGNALTVSGEQLSVGDKMLNFNSVTKDLASWSLKNVSGIKVISVVPSLDTGTCQLQTKRFNEEVSKINNVTIITISLDLPFAQARWCEAEGIDKVIVLSDYQDREFAKSTNLLIDELKLLTRTVFVLDNDNIVKYVEYVEEISKEPNYNAAIACLKSL